MQQHTHWRLDAKTLEQMGLLQRKDNEFMQAGGKLINTAKVLKCERRCTAGGQAAINSYARRLCSFIVCTCTPTSQLSLAVSASTEDATGR